MPMPERSTVSGAGPQLVSISLPHSESLQSDTAAHSVSRTTTYTATEAAVPSGMSSIGDSVAGTASYTESEDSEARRGPRHIFRTTVPGTAAGAVPAEAPGAEAAKAAEPRRRAGGAAAGAIAESVAGGSDASDPAAIDMAAVVVDVSPSAPSGRLSGSDASAAAPLRTASDSALDDAVAAVRTSNEESGSSSGDDAVDLKAKGTKNTSLCVPPRYRLHAHPRASILGACLLSLVCPISRQETKRSPTQRGSVRSASSKSCVTSLEPSEAAPFSARPRSSPCHSWIHHPCMHDMSCPRLPRSSVCSP